MQWAIVIAAFLAASVEFVEAFTLVADSPTADPGEHLEVYRRHHAHHLWYVLGWREFRHQLAILRPVSAPTGCPLPGRICPAHYDYEAATASRGIGHNGI